jgi:hypothetical protein
MDCRVIKDLIPMYIDNLTSEPSNELISEHIQNCEDCNQTLLKLKHDFIVGNSGEGEKAIESIPIQLVKRIKNRILENIIILASIALVAGILIGILSSSPVMFMALFGSISIVAFTSGIFLSIAVCRRMPPTRNKYQLIGNWTFLFSIGVSGLFFFLLKGFFNEFAKIAIILILMIIYNIVFSSTLRLYARLKWPKDAAVRAEAFTNKRLYAVAFSTLLVLTLLIAVPITILEKNRIVDNIELPFANDPELIGRWTSIDFVKSPEQFIPGNPSWKDRLFLKEMVFFEGGKMAMVADNTQGRRNVDAPQPWFSWTKGFVMHKGGDHTASKYFVREIQGAKYLLFEWKSGDTIYFHQPSQYYVLKKEKQAKEMTSAKSSPNRT